MLTISRLATYAGVTVRAVRHCRQIGLLPEPERSHSGYRMVVRLIKIRTLADAGVPLARVEEMLDAGAEEFARFVEDIDKELRAEIRRLQTNRRRIASLAAGENLALPESVTDYLDRLRSLGTDERYIELERDGWIMLAAQVPEQIDAIIAVKHEELDDPDTQTLYRLISESLDWSVDEPRLVEIADIMERLLIRALKSGEADAHGLDDSFADLLEATAIDASPLVERLLEMLRERGWRGWTRIERVPTDGADADARSRRSARVS